MKRWSLWVLFFLFLTFSVSTYAAPIIPGDLSSLQNVLDSHTQGGVSSVDVNTDYLDDEMDSSWRITATGGSVATIVIELAAYANLNEFGVYDPYDPTKKVTIFTGSEGEGAMATLSILLDGSVVLNTVDTGVNFTSFVFGYFLKTPNSDPNVYFYSDSSLNADGYDHMLAYQGKDVDYFSPDPDVYPYGLWSDQEFVLAWEDLPGNSSDGDYDDFVVMVESVDPIPEPATMLLVGASLLGIGFVGRRWTKRKV